MSVRVCTSEDMHPYECYDAPCRHCERRDDATHDPGVCALCDPEYDYRPNPYWKRRAKRREKAWSA